VRRSRAWRINFAKEFPSVHVPLSGRNAGVPGQHLQLVNGHPLVRQSRQGFVPHVVPVKVDPGERFAVRHAVATSLSCRLDAVGQQAQSLPRRSEALHVGSSGRVPEDVRLQTEKRAPAQELFEATRGLKRNDTGHLRLRVLFQEADPAMPPVNVLVLDLQHFAAPAAGVERPDDPVAHLVTRGQLDLGIPDVATDNLTTQRPGDVECRRKLALLNASLGTRPHRPDIIPGQLRGPTRRLADGTSFL